MTDSPTSKKKVIDWEIVVLVALLIAGVILIYYVPDLMKLGPPQWLERHQQRQKLTARVKAVGGWDTIKRDCLLLVKEHPRGFQTHRGDTEGLPPALVGLEPVHVDYHRTQDRVVIRLFGLHNPSGHSSPYLGLEILTGPPKEGYQPGKGYGGNGVGNYHSRNRILAEGVYEIY
jgi:hypothetical protein